MKAYILTCPSCGAGITLEKNVDRCFCPYCGTQVHISDEVIRSEINYSGTFSIRDEAKLKELELLEQARLKDEEEKRRQLEEFKTSRNSAWKRFRIVCFVYLALSFISSALSTLQGSLFPLFGYCAFGCYIVPFFYPYKYSSGNRFLRYLEWWLIMAFALALIFVVFIIVFPNRIIV